VKPFIKFNEDGSNGFVGAINGAKMDDNINNVATNEDTTATGDRWKA
jgi:hypothetical protein